MNYDVKVIPESLLSMVKYSSDSPSGLVWTVDTWSGKHFKRQVTKIGDPAGSVSKSTGYWVVGHKRGSYSNHRVIWELLYGIIPEGFVIDHKNKVRSDNALSNLRLITKAQNQQNLSLDKRNTTGYAGVRFISKESIEIRYCSAGKAYYKIIFTEGLSAEQALLLASDYRQVLLSAINS